MTDEHTDRNVVKWTFFLFLTFFLFPLWLWSLIFGIIFFQGLLFLPPFLCSFFLQTSIPWLFPHPFLPCIFSSIHFSLWSYVISIFHHLNTGESVHASVYTYPPPHKGPQSLFFVIQVVYNSWKWLLYTVNTGWNCYIALRLLQQIKTHGSHTKMLSELWNWVIECNWL